MQLGTKYVKTNYDGKPFWYKVKYCFARAPEISYFSVAGIFILVPMIAAYKMYTENGSRLQALSKYKIKYTVVRDDDPRLSEIIAEKEMGRHHFPNY